jgi:hypothetical protein
MGQLILNGRTSNSKPDEALIIGNPNRIFVPEINGFVPYDITINGLGRPPVLPGCVLYLPLWHSALSIPAGGSFKSLDAYQHVCSVTGAIWGYQGRTFDGVDDYIRQTTLFDVAPSAATLIAWVKPTDNDAQQYVIYKHNIAAPSNRFYLSIRGDTTDVVNFKTDGGGTAATATSTGTITYGSWQMLTGIYTGNGSKLIVYINTTSDTSDDNSGALANGTFGDFMIGIESHASELRGDYIGIIGEVLAYNRVVSSAEVAHIYNATKWRYV